MGTDVDSYFKSSFDDHKVTPQHKKNILRSIYDAMQSSSKNKLSYLEIGDITGMTSHQVLCAADELQRDGYVSLFAARDFKYKSFGLSNMVLGIIDTRHRNASDADKKAPEISSANRA